jgi:dTDP-glucose 4,6-dehydratase
VQAAHRTYGQNVVITRCSNNFGPYQFPEKLIPLWITNALEGKPWPIYGDGQNVRDWLYVEDHVEALWLALTRGQAGEIYNIGGHNEKTNWDVADALLSRLGLTRSVVVPVPDRAGHDRRYALDATKAEQELGWRPRHDWETALTATVVWYQTHRDWWRSIKQGTYQDDYRRRYPTLAEPQGD